MTDRMRRGGGFIQLPGETDEEYVERARVWDREQQRAAEQHARDHPEQWDPEVYEKLIKPTFKYPPMK